MHILILNWRDPKNPRSGGAEIITEKYASHWAKIGHQVTWITNTFTNCKTNENISGVKYIRLGPSLGFTVFELLITYPVFLFNAILLAAKTINQNHIDLVIDEIHGLPFFTPFYSKSRNVLLVCEVAGPIWDKMFFFPVNFFGRILEKAFYFIYRHIETWAISKNTKKDIYTINHNSRIRVLPLGIDTPDPKKLSKFPYPSAIFLGRLVKMKGLETAINAAHEITHQLPDFKLFVIGSGAQEYVASLHAPPCVKFLGQLSDTDKYKVLSKSHFLFHPSYKEGFGLTVLEAGSVGTPSLVRSGSSLDELVRDKITGLIFKKDEELSEKFILAYRRRQYTKLGLAAQKFARSYSWINVFKRFQI